MEVSNFELIGNTLKRIAVTSVPLQTQVCCTALSESEERLLIGCIDGSLAILDRNRGSTRIVKAAFIATLAAWHPEGVGISPLRNLQLENIISQLRLLWQLQMKRVTFSIMTLL